MAGVKVRSSAVWYALDFTGQFVKELANEPTAPQEKLSEIENEARSLKTILMQGYQPFDDFRKSMQREKCPIAATSATEPNRGRSGLSWR